MTPTSFLNTQSYQIYNRHIAKYCNSVIAAIILSDLANRFEYHSSQNELVSSPKHGEGWFYYTIDKCEERTCLTRKEQDRAIKILENLGMVQTQVIGLPARRHFRINEAAILEAIGLSKKVYSLYQQDKLESTNGTNSSYREEPKPKNLPKEGNGAQAQALPFLQKDEGGIGSGSKAAVAEPKKSKKAPEAKAVSDKPPKPRKFQRLKDHQEAFEWLLGLGLTDDGKPVSEDVISVLTHTYSRARLEDAYCHLLHKMTEQNFEPRSMIAVFRHLLTQEHAPSGRFSKANRDIANTFKKHNSWATLEIHEKYAVDSQFPGKDISLNIETESFKHSLLNLFKSIRGL